MASESIRFDFLTTGAGRMARDFKTSGDSAAAAARGARVLQDTIEKLGQKEHRTAEESARLARALRLTGDAEDRAAAKALAADIAIRRLADAEAKAARDSDTAESRLSRLGKALKDLHAPGLLAGGALLSPALIPAIGAALPAVGAVTASLAGAGIAAGAFAALARTAFSGAGQDAAKLAALQQKLSDATTARQRKNIQQQIADLEKGWSRSYTGLVTVTGKIQGQWQRLAGSVATPVLVPWLDAVSRLLGHMRPLVQPVAGLFRSWGQDTDRYFASRAGSSELQRMAAALGQFGADQMSAIGVFLSDLVRGAASLGRDLAAHNPDFGAFGTHLDQWGGAFRRWSESKAARADVGALLAWIHKNGPADSDLIKNLGGFLAKFAPGLSSAGVTELNLISGFLGFVNHLPKEFAQPLLDTAGALLLLSKTGVLKVGLKVTGPVVKWLTGGLINIGGGGAAAAEIRVAMVSGGAAAAAEIRAAMTGGALAAGAEGAGAGGLAGRAGAAGLGAALGPVFLGIFAGAAIAAYANQFRSGEHPAPPGQQGARSFSAPSPANINAWKQYDKAITQAGRDADTLRTRNLAPLLGETGKVSGGIQGLAGIMQNTLLAAMRAAGQHSDNLRTRNLLPLRGETGRVSGGIQGLAGMINPHLSGAIDTGGRHADTFRTRNLGPLQGSLSQTSGGVQGLQHFIGLLHGKTVNVGVHATGSGSVTFVSHQAGSVRLFTHPPSGGLNFFAAGGRVPGGYGGGDIRPALLEPGEAVIDKATTRENAATLRAWGIPGFAAGGLVRPVTAPRDFMVSAEQGAGHQAEGGYARAVQSAMFAAFARAVQAAANKVSGALLNPGAGITGNVGSGAFSASAAVAQAFAKSILWAYGWGTGQFPPLQLLWNQESGWRWNALNPSSGAYGIPQALPASKMAQAGADWRTNYQTQIRWGLGYIRAVYGSPAGAEAHERAFNWYGSGLDGVFRRPTVIGVGERGPERVRVQPLVPAGRGGTGTTQLEVIGGGQSQVEQFLLYMIRQLVRVKGGGDVQVAFGQRR